MAVNNTYALGYREKVLFKSETVDTFGTPVHPAGGATATPSTDGAQIIGATFEYTQERVNRADKTSSRSYYERMTHRKNVNWSVNGYLLPTGSTTPASKAPDFDLVLLNGFGDSHAGTNTTVATSDTATSFTVAAAAGLTFEVGDGVGWANAAGDLEVSFVTDITGDVLTVSPGFSAIPQVGNAIVTGVTYKLADNLIPLTITRVLDNCTDVFTGCIVNNLQMDFPGDGEGLLTASGQGKTAFSSGCSTLGAAALVGDTSLTVATGDGVKFSADTMILIHAEGANTDEAVLVTAVAGDVLTVTRAQGGTVASAHAISADVGPWEPVCTYTGSPVSGTVGDFIIVGASGARTAVPVTTTQVTVNNNAAMRNNQYGTDSATGYTLTNRRDVQFSTTMWLTKDFYMYYNAAKAFTSQQILIQLGKTIGKTVASYMPAAEFNIPAINGGGAEEVMVPISGVGLSTKADPSVDGFMGEVYLVFI
jgi:hypothetical protein